MKFKEVIYWCSIVAPIWDIVRGAISGISECVMKYSDNRRFIDEINCFNEDNERNEKW